MKFANSSLWFWRVVANSKKEVKKWFYICRAHWFKSRFTLFVADPRHEFCSKNLFSDTHINYRHDCLHWNIHQFVFSFWVKWKSLEMIGLWERKPMSGLRVKIVDRGRRTESLEVNFPTFNSWRSFWAFTLTSLLKDSERLMTCWHKSLTVCVSLAVSFIFSKENPRESIVVIKTIYGTFHGERWWWW